MEILTVTILISMAFQGKALTAYDCEDEGMRFDIIDLTEPKPCPEPSRDFEPSQSIMVQIVQTDTTFPIDAYQCSVVRSLKVTKCGFTSITYGSKWITWKEQITITPQECRKMIERQEYTMNGVKWTLTLGTQVSKQFFIHGQVDNNGNCQVEDFSVNGAHYKGHYLEAFVTVLIKPVRGMVDTADGWVTFLNGLRARVSEEYLEDNIEGSLIWTNKRIDCKKQVSQVYKGSADLYQYKKMDTPSLKESMILISDNATKQYAGLVLKDPQIICQSRCYGTQVPGVLACPFNHEIVPMPDSNFVRHFNPKEINVQTQISFLHLTSNLQMRARFEDIVADVCMLDRKILFNKVQAIAGVENPYSLMDIYGPGHHIYKGGVNAYVARCVPVEVKMAEFPNCTNEIPVLVKDQLRFADPLTFVLKPFPTIVVCSAVMPIRWKIGGEWYCATPAARPCRAPTQLNVTTGHRRHEYDMTAGLEGGIYTKEQLREHKLFQLNHGSREAVISKLTTTATEYASTNGRLGSILGPQDIKELSEQLSWHLVPFVWMLGTAWHYLMGLGLLLLLIKFICNTSVRAYTLYRHRGCGCWMLTAFWDTAFYLLTSPGRLLEAALENIKQPLEDEEKGVRVPIAEAKVYQEMVDELASYLLRYRTGLMDVERIRQEAERMTRESENSNASTGLLGTYTLPKENHNC